MNYFTYHKHQFVPYDRTLEFYFTGCHNQCNGCHNYQLWEKSYGKRKTIEQVLNEVEDYPEIAKMVHVLGGEPLEQDLSLIAAFPYRLKEMGYHDIILFTGLTIPELKTKLDDFHVDFLLGYDYVKVGRYDETQPNVNHIKQKYFNLELATVNQKLYTVSELEELL